MSKYVALLHELREQDKTTLCVDFQDVIAFDNELAEAIEIYYYRFLREFKAQLTLHSGLILFFEKLSKIQSKNSTHSMCQTKEEIKNSGFLGTITLPFTSTNFVYFC
jgi:hypothetical protein